MVETDMAMEDKAATIVKELIKEFEGLHLESYHCPAGIKTIGYGHTIAPHETLPASITKEQAEQLLDKDIRAAKADLYRYCRVPLNHNQEAALISFIFNLGAGAFQSSTLRQKLNRSEYLEASNQLLRWVYAGGIKLHGLVRRRIAERNLFLTEVGEEHTRSSSNYTPATALASPNTSSVIASITSAAKSLQSKLKTII